MKALLIVFLSILTFSVELVAQGYTFDSTAKRLYGLPDMESYGFASKKLPRAFTLEEYAPPVMDQEEYAICVGWASAYAAASISFNSIFKLTDPIFKYFFSFDPYYSYSLAAVFDSDTCEQGMMIQDAIISAERYGFKRYHLPPDITCRDEISYIKSGLELSKCFSSIQAYELKKSNVGKDVSKKDLINYTKMLLNDYFPIVVGVRTDSSTFNRFNQTFSVNSTGMNELWTMDKDSTFLGGHAMCILGYDDDKYNRGAFRLMNSWGTEIGDSGFVWLTYDDFYNYAEEIFALKLNFHSDANCIYGDCLNGYGAKILSDSSFYEGQFFDGMPNGYGLHVFQHNFSANKLIYVGEFKNGLKEGDGFIGFEGEIFIVKYTRGEIVRDSEMGFANVVDTEISILREKIESQYKINKTDDISIKLQTKFIDE